MISLGHFLINIKIIMKIKKKTNSQMTVFFFCFFLSAGSKNLQQVHLDLQ